MTGNETTCEIVDERDLDTRYLAGRLNPDEAEGFEAHFFACERCWALVQQGLEVQSAFQANAALPGSASGPSLSRGVSIRRWWGLAAAAGIAAVVLGTWWAGQRTSTPLAEDVLRGGDTPFVVTSSGSSSTLRAAWPRLPNADLYRIRLYAADGTLAAERELTDTAIVLVRDSIPLPRQGTAFWEVQALDRLRNPIARSELTRAVLPSSAP